MKVIKEYEVTNRTNCPYSGIDGGPDPALVCAYPGIGAYEGYFAEREIRFLCAIQF